MSFSLTHKCKHGSSLTDPDERIQGLLNQLKTKVLHAAGEHRCMEDQAEAMNSLAAFLVTYNKDLANISIMSLFYALSVDAYLKRDIPTVRACFICARLINHVLRAGGADEFFQLLLNDCFQQGMETPWNTACIVRTVGQEVDRNPLTDYFVCFPFFLF